MSATFDLHIRAADRDLYEGKCVSMKLPLGDGQLGLMANHAPMAAALVPGVLECKLPDGKTLVAVNGHGILRFEHNDALLLLDTAEYPGEIDPERARQSAENARAALAAGRTPREKRRAAEDLARAENRLRAAEKYGRDAPDVPGAAAGRSGTA